MLRNVYTDPLGEGYTSYQPTQACLLRNPTHYRFS